MRTLCYLACEPVLFTRDKVIAQSYQNYSLRTTRRYELLCQYSFFVSFLFFFPPCSVSTVLPGRASASTIFIFIFILVIVLRSDRSHSWKHYPRGFFSRLALNPRVCRSFFYRVISCR